MTTRSIVRAVALATVAALSATPLAACDGSPELPATSDADAAAATDAASTATDATLASDAATPDDTSSPKPPARCELAPNAVVALPRDDARHVAAGEWYYWTGHLQTADGAWLGFQLTVLLAGPPGAAVAVTHASITDVARDDYHHAAGFGLDDRSPERGFDFTVGDVVATGGDGQDHLVIPIGDDGDGASLELDLVDHRGPVARHGTGFKDYGAGISTYYYSRPRMTATGTLTRGGVREPVAGRAWFDHQWGSLASATASHWDWLGVQLDDGSELMVTAFPLPGGERFATAELTDRDCHTALLEGDGVALTPRRDWTNPETLCTYPSGWDVQVGDLHLGLEPATLDQEMRADPIDYWEGAATVDGDATGRAYVELVGYCALPGLSGP